MTLHRRRLHSGHSYDFLFHSVWERMNPQGFSLRKWEEREATLDFLTEKPWRRGCRDEERCAWKQGRNSSFFLPRALCAAASPLGRFSPRAPSLFVSFPPSLHPNFESPKVRNHARDTVNNFQRGSNSYMNLINMLFEEFVLLKGVNADFCLNRPYSRYQPSLHTL